MVDWTDWIGVKAAGASSQFGDFGGVKGAVVVGGKDCGVLG